MDSLAVLAVFVVIVLVIGLFGLAERRRFEAYIRVLIHKDYGKFQEKEISQVRAACIPAYFEKHRDENSIDDITASDLELDRLFGVMNLTYSSAGEEMLYHSLRTPLFSEEKLKRRREQIDYFRKEEKEREELQFLFAKMGKNERYSLYDYLDFADKLEENRALGMHFLAPLLLAAAVLMVILKTELGILLLIGAIIFNIGWYFKSKGEVQAYIVTLKYVMADIRAGRRLVDRKIPLLEEESGTLKEALQHLKDFTKGSGMVFSGDSNSGNPTELLRDYVNMVLHIDLIAFYHMFRQMQLHRDDIDTVHSCLGYIEMLIAAGSFMDALGAVCTPEYDGKEAAKELYHPLIDDPVKNSYELKSCMLLTGSNASGKSTFLKTMALNQLLGQCFYFACADEFHTSFHRIYTSMALRDNLEQQESYFMVEIKAMRRILEAAEKPGAQIACYVDEVLRGTNTVERIAASTQILRYMARKKLFSMAATHDIELTELLAGDYENYHFEEEIKDGDVLFNYRLMKGKAGSRNAIKLLSVMGYDENLVRQAEELAGHFLKEGVWT